MEDLNVTRSRRISLPWSLWISYGVGHILNDICASMWFTYLLVFFHLVLKFDAVSSGIILFVGQLADAISTTFVGIESDKSNNCWLCKYGKRKTWHLFGTICILLSFPFIFMPCIGCSNAHVWAKMIYFSAFVIIFQFGWATVQISHLALIPQLTPDNHQRTQLTSIRYVFTVISTLLVYIVTWISLKSGQDDSSQISSADAINFQKVVYFGLILGIVTSVIFHVGVKEELTKKNGNAKINHKSVADFLRNLQFYQVAITYMSSRVFVNIIQVYIPLYLHETLSQKAETLASIPLLMYMGSIGASTFINKLNKHFGRKVSFVWGSVAGLISCFWIKFGNRYEFEIYPIAILLGVSGTILIVTSLGVTADLIGLDTNSGAFVYGAMSFVDKISNGVAVMAIQYWKCSPCPDYYKNVLSIVCGGAAFVGAVSILSLKSSVRKETEEVDETRPLLG